MKTTVQIPDALLARAKAVARREKTTLAALVTEGLRSVVEARTAPERRRFVLRDASVGGKGMNPEFAGSWEAVRAAVYEGRGG